MKIKSLIKRIILYGSAVLFINYAGMPFSSFLYQEQVKEIKNKKIQKVCKTEDYLPELKTLESGEALTYLRAAHAITSKFLSTPIYFKAIKDPKGEKYENNLQGEVEKAAAFEGVADCVYFSTFTFSNFNYICDKLGKPELKEQVRYCDGRVKEQGQEWNHAWLQYKKDGKWVDYNTVFDLFSQKSKINFKALNFKCPQGKSHATYFIDSKNGKLKGHMHWGNILKGKASLFDQIYEDLSRNSD